MVVMENGTFSFKKSYYTGSKNENLNLVLRLSPTCSTLVSILPLMQHYPATRNKNIISFQHEVKTEQEQFS